MRIFLIRHGETVDNVANVYAGVKDSALTVHGSLQAERLAKFFTGLGLRFTHVFSSDLQRAYKTANAICIAQSRRNSTEEDSPFETISLPLLREQDFGYYEGKPFYARPRDSSKSGKEDRGAQHQDDPEFRDVESKEAMGMRTKAFLEEHLVPIIGGEAQDDKSAVAIVSHGILLSHLWRRLLELLPENSVTLAPGLSIGNSAVRPLEYLGGWSNTGYLELDVQRAEGGSDHEWQLPPPSKDPHPKPSQLELFQQERSPSVSSELDNPQPEPSRKDVQLASLHGIKVVIKTVNGKEHLTGLKRTRGGVGSSRYDEGQKTIESFFKKRKV